MLTRRGHICRKISGETDAGTLLFSIKIWLEILQDPEKKFFALRATSTKKLNLAYPPKISSHTSREKDTKSISLPLKTPKIFCVTNLPLEIAKKCL